MALILCILLLVYLVLPACLAWAFWPTWPLWPLAFWAMAIVLCTKLPFAEAGFFDLPLLAHYSYHYYHCRPARVRVLVLSVVVIVSANRLGVAVVCGSSRPLSVVFRLLRLTAVSPVAVVLVVWSPGSALLLRPRPCSVVTVVVVTVVVVTYRHMHVLFCCLDTRIAKAEAASLSCQKESESCPCSFHASTPLQLPLLPLPPRPC